MDAFASATTTKVHLWLLHLLCVKYVARQPITEMVHMGFASLVCRLAVPVSGAVHL